MSFLGDILKFGFRPSNNLGDASAASLTLGDEATAETDGTYTFPYISNKRSLAPSKVDGVVLYTCAMTDTSNRVVCSDGAFTSADVGKYFSMYSMNTASLVLTAKRSGTITNVVNATTVDLSVPATATVASANGRFCYGTDRGAEIQALFDLVVTRGGYASFPTGKALSSIDLVVPGGVVVEGQGWDYPSTREFLNRGSSLLRVGTFASTSFLSLGSAGSDYDSGDVCPQLLNIGVEAAERVGNVVNCVAARARVEHCCIWRGNASALQANQDNWILDNVIGQMNIGDVVLAGGDMHLFRNHIRGSGNGGHQVKVSNVSNVEIAHNHMFKGGVGTASYATLLGNNVYVQWTGYNDGKYSNVSIDNNIFDGTAGAHVSVVVGATAACHPKGLAIRNNHIFQNNLPDNTYPVIALSVDASSTLGQIAILGNTGIAVLDDADTNCYSAFIAATGAGTYGASGVANNHVSRCLAGITGFTPSTGQNTNTFTNAADAVTVF